MAVGLTLSSPHIAIIGAGFSGLATAWHLLTRSINVTIFDSAGIGGGASGIAAGLMHPYAGAHAKLNWQGHLSLQATIHLLDVAEKTLGQSVSQRHGTLRLAISDEQQKWFRKSTAANPDLKWWEPNRCQSLIPGIASKPGIFIPSAISVDCPSYLKGLWQACSNLGARYHQQKIEQLAELNHFDAIVVAAGAFANQFIELNTLPITRVKGQILELAWPALRQPLPCVINSQAYVVMSNNATCYVGSTYEREFIQEEADPGVARELIMPKVIELLPYLKGSAIVSCRAGIRASAKGHLPLIKRFQDNGWVITGMGSKGLLYHALLGERLAKAIISETVTKV